MASPIWQWGKEKQVPYPNSGMEADEYSIDPELQPGRSMQTPAGSRMGSGPTSYKQQVWSPIVTIPGQGAFRPYPCSNVRYPRAHPDWPGNIGGMEYLNEQVLGNVRTAGINGR